MKQTSILTAHGRIALRDTGGTGPAVLLIHGNSGSGTIFRNQLTGDLAQRYRMLAPDLPGHGESDNAIDPAKAYTIPGYAETIIEILGAMRIEHPIVFGWSLGGHIGVEMLPRLPGMRGLMLTGAPPVSLLRLAWAFRRTPAAALTRQEIFSAADVEVFARACCGGHGDPLMRDAIERTHGLARITMQRHFRSGRLRDQGRIVAKSRVPIAIVNGADEPFVNIVFLAKVKVANLWEGRQHLIEGGGHSPFWRQPQAFNAIFERFLGDVGGGA